MTRKEIEEPDEHELFDDDCPPDDPYECVEYPTPVIPKQRTHVGDDFIACTFKETFIWHCPWLNGVSD